MERWSHVLNDREKFVLGLYYGLDTPPTSMREIAEELGVSQARVRQIRVQAEYRIGFASLDVRADTLRRWEQRRDAIIDELDNATARRVNQERSIKKTDQRIEELTHRLQEIDALLDRDPRLVDAEKKNWPGGRMPSQHCKLPLQPERKPRDEP